MVLSVALASGCIAVPETTATKPAQGSIAGGDLLEVVTLVATDGTRGFAVLSRKDIAASLGGDVTAVESKDWKDIILSRDKLIDALRKTRFGTRDEPGKAEYAELFVSGSVVKNRYALADVGVKDARGLLEKFFEKRGSPGGDWWIRKSAARSEAVDENGLIVLAKGLGFEATRTEIAPVLFVKPPAQLR